MNKEYGFSFFGLIFLLAILAMVGSVAIKVFPPYIDFLSISDAVKQTLEQPRMSLQTQEAVMKKIENQLSINNIRLSDYGDDAITLSRDEGTLRADIAYSVEAPVFASEEFAIDLNMQFNRTVTTRASE